MEKRWTRVRVSIIRIIVDPTEDVPIASDNRDYCTLE